MTSTNTANPVLKQGVRVPLTRQAHTPWGIYAPGTDVTVLGGPGDGWVEVCLDPDSHTNIAYCLHRARVPATSLYTWPDHVAHGTEEGHWLHWDLLEPPCFACRNPA